MSFFENWKDMSRGDRFGACLFLLFVGPFFLLPYLLAKFIQSIFFPEKNLELYEMGVLMAFSAAVVYLALFLGLLILF